MRKLRGVALMLLAGSTTACCLWKPPADPNHVLAAENAYGKPPEGAKEVGNRTFLRRVEEGKLRVLSPQRDREAELVQFQSDLQALAAIPQAQRSPAVLRILADAAAGTDPLREETVPVVDASTKAPSGTSLPVLP